MANTTNSTKVLEFFRKGGSKTNMATKVGKYKKGGPTKSQKVRAKSDKTAARGAKAVDEGRERKATRLLKKAARQETRSIKLEEREKQKMKKGGTNKAFKVHMMYDPKTGKGYKAKVMADHLRLKKLGYGHTKPKKRNSGN
jgi:hypothetical protein|tara:strand:- start:463 stop:885 length:423 start_codon:yes stop_codon:yes gene_type:complete